MKTAATIYVIVWVLGIVGWINNLINVVQGVTGPSVEITALLIVQLVGLLAAPLGSVMGLVVW